MKKWLNKQKELILKAKLFLYHQQIVVHPTTLAETKFDTLALFSWVNIFGLDENGDVLLVRQYRVGTDEITLELPAGAIEFGEDPLEAAKREFLEETGYEALEIEFIGSVDVNPAFMNNQCYFYFVPKSINRGVQKLDEFEEIEVVRYSPAQFRQAILEGEINHSLVVACYQFVCLKNLIS